MASVSWTCYNVQVAVLDGGGASVVDLGLVKVWVQSVSLERGVNEVWSLNGFWLLVLRCGPWMQVVYWFRGWA